MSVPDETAFQCSIYVSASRHVNQYRYFISDPVILNLLCARRVITSCLCEHTCRESNTSGRHLCDTHWTCFEGSTGNWWDDDGLRRAQAFGADVSFAGNPGTSHLRILSRVHFYLHSFTVKRHLFWHIPGQLIFLSRPWIFWKNTTCSNQCSNYLSPYFECYVNWLTYPR